MDFYVDLLNNFLVSKPEISSSPFVQQFSYTLQLQKQKTDCKTKKHCLMLENRCYDLL